MDELILKAKPVFLEGLTDETNIQAGFICELELTREDIEANDANVFVTARSFYRLYVNGKLAAHGPARSTHGYLRVDAVDVGKYLKTGKNCFAFEVTSYGDPFGSYSNDTVLGKSLLRAAVKIGNKTVVSNEGTFKGIRLYQRAQYSERISHCREMTENYTLDGTYFSWRTGAGLCRDKICVVQDGSILLERRSKLPSLDIVKAEKLIDCGRAFIDENVEFHDNWFERNIAYYKDLSERPLGDYTKTREIPLLEGDCARFGEGGELLMSGDAKDGTFFAQYDLGKPELGFIDIDLWTEKGGIVDIVHVESNEVYSDKMESTGGANPVTRLHVPGGNIRFVAMEPALARYLTVYFRGCGDVKLNLIGLRRYTVPDERGGTFCCSDEDVNRLFEAAALTLRLNTLDIFMDCPERERGGWLCDSYWTGRAARMILGDHRVEKDFLENFLLTDADEMWKGFFPECYPAQKNDYKNFPGITTWSFWLMEELCEYIKESGDREFAEKYRKRVEAFVDGAMTFRGQTGLLENMPCIFIDWSLANDVSYVTPVSTAANCLFAKVLKDLGDLYGNEEWKNIGEKMMNKLREAVGTPGYIPDAFDIKDGKLAAKDLHTESCAFLAVWCGLFDGIKAENTLFNVIRCMGVDPDFQPMTRLGKAGLFIGLQYRFDMLSKLGEHERLLKELKKLYLGQLKEGPGTLWEGTGIRQTSYCHGFTSFAGMQLMRDVLGIGIPDESTKTVRIAPHPCGLRWAKGTANTSDGVIALSWKNRGSGKAEEIRLTLPPGWKAVTE